MQNIVENSAHRLGLDYIEDRDYDSPLLKARTKQIFCGKVKETPNKYDFDKPNESDYLNHIMDSPESDDQQEEPIIEDDKSALLDKPEVNEPLETADISTEKEVSLNSSEQPLEAEPIEHESKPDIVEDVATAQESVVDEVLGEVAVDENKEYVTEEHTAEQNIDIVEPVNEDVTDNQIDTPDDSEVTEERDGLEVATYEENGNVAVLEVEEEHDSEELSIDKDDSVPALNSDDMEDMQNNYPVNPILDDHNTVVEFQASPLLHPEEGKPSTEPEIEEIAVYGENEILDVHEGNSNKKLEISNNAEDNSHSYHEKSAESAIGEVAVTEGNEKLEVHEDNHHQELEDSDSLENTNNIPLEENAVLYINETIDSTPKDEILEGKNTEALSLVDPDSEYSLSGSLGKTDIIEPEDKDLSATTKEEYTAETQNITQIQQEDNGGEPALDVPESPNNVASCDVTEIEQHSNYNVSHESYHLDFSAAQHSHHEKIEEESTASEDNNDDDSSELIPHNHDVIDL